MYADHVKYLLLHYLQIVSESFSPPIPEDSANEFAIETVRVLKQMLMSKMPIIPWIGLTEFDEQYTDVHLSATAASMDEKDFISRRIVGFKVPVLLSCAHRKVKVVKGRVELALTV